MEQWHCNNKNLQYLIPILFDLNTSAFREANSATKPLRNYRKVILLIMRNKGFDNESRYWCLATTHLNLKSNPIQFNHPLVPSLKHNLKVGRVFKHEYSEWNFTSNCSFCNPNERENGNNKLLYCTLFVMLMVTG